MSVQMVKSMRGLYSNQSEKPKDVTRQTRCTSTETPPLKHITADYCNIAKDRNTAYSPELASKFGRKIAQTN
jgi:hypothetical protein